MDVHLPGWLHQFGGVMISLIPGGLFSAWCLWAVNWRKTWPMLAAGGWVPLCLIAGFAAYVWARVWPSSKLFLGVAPVPNILWQLGSVASLVCVGLFCGWLQGRYAWAPVPEEIDLEPPAPSHDDHGHHDHAH